jgi:hypothetical protein
MIQSEITVANFTSTIDFQYRLATNNDISSLRPHPVWLLRLSLRYHMFQKLIHFIMHMKLAVFCDVAP